MQSPCDTQNHHQAKPADELRLTACFDFGNMASFFAEWKEHGNPNRVQTVQNEMGCNTQKKQSAIHQILCPWTKHLPNPPQHEVKDGRVEKSTVGEHQGHNGAHRF